MVLNIASISLIARYLGPEGVGLIQYCIALVLLVTPFAQLGLVQTVTKEFVKSNYQEGSIFGTVWCLRFIGSIIGVLIAWLYITYTRSGDHITHLLVLIISSRIVFETFQVITNWFESQTLSGSFVKTNLIAIGMSFLAKVLAVSLDYGLIGIAIAYALEPLIMAIGWIYVFSKALTKKIIFSFDVSFSKEILKISWPLFLSAFGAVLNLKIDQVMLGEMSTNFQVGIYSAAVQLSEVSYFLPIVIMASVFPKLLKFKDEGNDKYNSYLQKLLNLNLSIALTIALFIQFTAYYIILIIFGSEFYNSVNILIIHIWGGLFVYMRAVFSKWLIAEGYTKYSMLSQFFGAGVNIVLNLVLIPRYGALGAAVATVISYASSGYIVLFFSKKTRPFAMMMSKSIIFPVFFTVRFCKLKLKGN